VITAAAIAMAMSNRTSPLSQSGPQWPRQGSSSSRTQVLHLQWPQRPRHRQLRPGRAQPRQEPHAGKDARHAGRCTDPSPGMCASTQATQEMSSSTPLKLVQQGQRAAPCAAQPARQCGGPPPCRYLYRSNGVITQRVPAWAVASQQRARRMH
jgi:hypothetical protein